MAKQRTAMNKVKEILQLVKYRKLSARQTSKVTGISRTVVGEYVRLFEASGLTLEEICLMGDAELLEVFSPGSSRNERLARLRERFEGYTSELKRPGVSLMVLWEEYRQKEPDGFRYSQFCHHYRDWCRASELSLHIEHKAGERLYTDFTGKKLSWLDSVSGVRHEAEIFVAVLSASQRTYVEAVASQSLHDWIRVNENALRYFGGSPQAIVSDNLKSAVTKANRYEAEINATYKDFCGYYNMVPFPARPYKPKDKSLVEGAVKIVYSRIFAALRERCFSSLGELNAAIRERLEEYNNRPFRGTKLSRRELFEQTEKAALKPLPIGNYELKQFHHRKVTKFYHIHLPEDDHYYSVPWRYVGQSVMVISTTRTVSVYLSGDRIAMHERSTARGKYSTLAEHMPPKHRWQTEWNPERFVRMAGEIGANTATLVGKILEQAEYPPQAYKVCWGLLALRKKYSSRRLDLACKRALEYGSYTLRFVHNTLKNNLEKSQPEMDFEPCVPEHENIRGAAYYAQRPS